MHLITWLRRTKFYSMIFFLCNCIKKSIFTNNIQVKFLIIYLFILISTKELSIFYVFVGMIVSNQVKKKSYLFFISESLIIELCSKNLDRKVNVDIQARTVIVRISSCYLANRLSNICIFYNDRLKRASNFSRYVSQRVCRTKLNII